jgi:hypothetical protein
MGMVQVVGAHPSQRPPARGGQITVAHQRLAQLGAPPNAVAQLHAPGAALALSLLSRGVQPALAMKAAGYNHPHSSGYNPRGASLVEHPLHRTGQSLTAPAAVMAAQAPASYPSPAQWSPLQEVPLPGNGPRTFPMGFGLTAIAAGASTTINANPQVNFRPDRLVIPDSIAPSFMINDFKIGMRSQFVAPGSVPAQSFTQGAIDTLMLLDTVNVGQFVTLDVTNVSTQTVNFAATLFGKTLNS